MPVLVTGTVKHVNGRDPVAEAQDILMPDGKRLDAYTPVFPIRNGVPILEPETHYYFGSVSELSLTLAQKDDSRAHEYWFQFRPQEGFAGLTIAPEVKWVSEPQYPSGKTCVVGICMGMAVMAVV